ncbi:MAG: nucleoside 2-deoxyribosyltransferase [Chitinophagaceae bacterium]|nr:nucleoside 2-deoxyribosyltransferase [Chitinophagaceae bacterium]
MKIYFAGSIRGGRDDQKIYFEIIEHLKKMGTVLTEHICNDLTEMGEREKTDDWIFNRDMDWLTESDVLVAEVTTPSLGVGYEISKAESLGKPVICLFRGAGTKSLSAMIAGNKDLNVYRYGDINDALQYLDSFFVEIMQSQFVTASSQDVDFQNRKQIGFKN